jgi:hypothetical protein
MPLTKATTNIINLNKDTDVNEVTIGKGGGNLSSNTALGRDSLRENITGENNTAVGVAALVFNESGSENTSVGVSSLRENITGTNNSAFGRSALRNNTGDFNTAIGHKAGEVNTSGTNNVFIGSESSGTAGNVSNQVNIYNGSVTARFTGAASGWTFTSDERDKKNIEDLTIGLDFINQLKARKFAWDMRNSDVDKGKEASGFIAQEILQVVNVSNAKYTNLVDESNSEQYTLTVTNLIPILVKAVQQLSAKVAELEAKI